MATKDFNLELDSYISKVREKKARPVVANKSKKIRHIREESVPKEISRSTSIYVIKRPKSGWQKVKEKFVDVSEVDFEKRKTISKDKISEQQEFDQEYDEMRKEGKKTGFFSWLSNIFADDVDESYKDIDDENTAITKSDTEKKITVETESEMEDESTMKESRKSRGMFSKLSYIFGLTPEEEEKAVEGASEAVLTELKTDLKTIATISIGAFNKLPKAEFTRLKNSPEFAKFKEILKKHGIVKDK
jgi:hypothetical protein